MIQLVKFSVRFAFLKTVLHFVIQHISLFTSLGASLLVGPVFYLYAIHRILINTAVLDLVSTVKVHKRDEDLVVPIFLVLFERATILSHPLVQ